MLLVRLRRIGDAVLITPCLSVLKKWRPDIQIDVVLDSATSAVLKNHPYVRNVIEVPAGTGTNAAMAAWNTLWQCRARHYDFAVNLHGGTTSMFLTLFSGAGITVALAKYPASRLANVRVPDPREVWGRDDLHTVENQLALFKWLGVPTPLPLPPTSVVADPAADIAVRSRIASDMLDGRYAVVHPTASTANKQWASIGFTETMEFLHEKYGLPSVVIGTPCESGEIRSIVQKARTPAVALCDAPLSEVIALIGRSSVFVGNDSGPAHIAAAMGIPQVVIFVHGASINTWRPWTDAPAQIVRVEGKDERLCLRECQPCGYPNCHNQISFEQVRKALETVLAERILNSEF